MVCSLEEFKNDAESIIEDAMVYGEPVIIKTGMGNMFLIGEEDYRGMMSLLQSETEEAMNNIK